MFSPAGVSRSPTNQKILPVGYDVDKMQKQWTVCMFVWINVVLFFLFGRYPNHALGCIVLLFLSKSKNQETLPSPYIISGEEFYNIVEEQHNCSLVDEMKLGTFGLLKKKTMGGRTRGLLGSVLKKSIIYCPKWGISNVHDNSAWLHDNNLHEFAAWTEKDSCRLPPYFILKCNHCIVLYCILYCIVSFKWSQNKMKNFSWKKKNRKENNGFT